MRVIWAISFLKEIWTELQWKMLLASVRSWKKYNFNTTTVLYASDRVLTTLKKLNRLELWDEVYEDKDSYLSGCFTEASWDYPKVEALYREQGKVLYVDYDILFRGEILSKLDSKYNWFWCEESTNFPYYYKKSEEILGLPPNLRKKIYHSDIAYNTGILYVDKEYLTSWRKTYLEVMPSTSKYVGTENTMKFALTVGQSNIVGIVPRESVRFIVDVCGDCITHFLGRYKNDTKTVEYREYLHIVDTLYPDLEFQTNYRKLKIV